MIRTGSLSDGILYVISIGNVSNLWLLMFSLICSLLVVHLLTHVSVRLSTIVYGVCSIVADPLI